MARNKEKSHGKRPFTLPIAVVAGFAVPATKTLTVFNNGGAARAATWLTYAMTGYDMDAQKWRLQNMAGGMLPVLIGMAAHKVASPLGVNRALAQAGIPLIRI